MKLKPLSPCARSILALLGQQEHSRMDDTVVRSLIAGRAADVGQAIASIVRRGLVVYEDRRGEPLTLQLTSAGAAIAREELATS